MKSKIIELLAPAKNLEYGKAAIDAGADAVYIGAPDFTARSKAVNTLEDIAELIEYAHFFYVKVYIALNTILYDSEIGKAEKLIHDLYEIGADAIIFQDPSILDMKLPPIQLHASTQFNNYDIERIKFISKNGADRIILARELNIEQLELINNEVNSETEVFIHGALCWSFSGQCYISKHIGGRSANRGECAQPCRKKWTLIDSKNNIIEKEKYLLSLKDMNRSDYLKQILNSGVSSLKIEGRLKNLEYVKNITAYYSCLLNKILPKEGLERSSSGKCIYSFIPDPKKTFNRGFTDYHFSEKNNSDITYYSPKSLGEEIGIVADKNKSYFSMNGQSDLIPGDGICFYKNGVLKGGFVFKVEGINIYVDNIEIPKPGTLIYRNFNKNFVKSVNKQDSAKRSIAIEVEVNHDNIVITDEDNNKVVRKINSVDPINNIDSFKSAFKKSFSKTGDTQFEVQLVEIVDGYDRFIPIKDINQLRREMLAELKVQRIKSYRRKPHGEYSLDKYYKKEISADENVVNSLSKHFYLKRGVDFIEEGYDINPEKSIALMKSDNCILANIGKCLKRDSLNLPLYIYDDEGNKFKLHFDCKKCQMSVWEMESSNEKVN